MASASSVSISSISGTNANTFIIGDDWDAVLPEKVETAPPVYLDFNANPLALVCAMFRKGKQAYEAAEVLNGVGTRLTQQIDISQSIEREDEDRANTILKYFANKHTMRRIKGEWVSKYMLAIDEIADNPKRINKEHVGIVVSLPRIYEQNRSLESVMKGRKSVEKIETLSFARWRGEVEFVKRLNYKAGHANEYQYYFSTPKNYLMRVVVKKGEYGQSAWDTLSSLGKLHIDADIVYTFAVKGYDFNVLQFSPEHVTITAK